MKTSLLALVFASTVFVSTEPDDSKSGEHHATARVAYSRGELIRARSEWREALRLARRPSTRIQALDGLGRVSRRLAAFDDAFAAFEKVLKIAPTELRAAFEIGATAAACQCRIERGQEALMRYLMSFPLGDMPSREDAEKLLKTLNDVAPASAGDAKP